jgi:hypothetical protein
MKANNQTDPVIRLAKTKTPVISRSVKAVVIDIVGLASLLLNGLTEIDCREQLNYFHSKEF